MSSNIYRKVWVGAILAFVLMGFDNSPALACCPPLDQVANLIRVPLVRQGTNYTCGVAAFHSVIGYYGQDIRDDKLIKKLRANRQGTKYQNILKFANELGYDAVMYTNQTLEQLQAFIDQGKPTIVIIQAWPDEHSADWSKNEDGNYVEPVDWINDWEDGHYVVAVGYDEDYVYFMDPAILGNYTCIPVAEFLERWHDRDRRRVFNHAAIVIDGKDPAYDPNEIKPLR